jgi:bacterial/archaeal transporter family protein
MHLVPWFWFALIVLVTWGIVGLLQKLSTNEISAESALIWFVAGCFVMVPVFYPGKVLFTYSTRSVLYILSCGVANAIGAWALLAAMKSGGKASIIVPLTALYPLGVALIAPIILHESITLLQSAGVVCALVAVVLLSTEGRKEESDVGRPEPEGGKQ